MELDANKVERSRALIAKSYHIVIHTHMAPDGDAMGSALAMWHYVQSVIGQDPEKSVHVIVPNAYPSFFKWMPGAGEILIYEQESARCNALISSADLFICTDFNDPGRIGPVGAKMLENASPKILIDHHIMESKEESSKTALSKDDVWDVVFSYPDACSSCMIVYRLISQFTIHNSQFTIHNSQFTNHQSPITNEIATCIYTGLMTDTGNFSYNSTSGELYEIIAVLIRSGIRKDEIYNAVYNQYSTDRVRLMGYALYRKMRIYPDHHLALITLSADELERYHYEVGDTEGLVNMPLQIADVYYSVYMREERPKPGTPKPRIRVSFRSQGERPVNIWASEVFHGGGHMNASGGELFGSLEQAVQLFEKTYRRYVR